HYDRTTITGVTSIPASRSRYLAVQYGMPVDLRTVVGLSTAFTRSAPGYKITEEEIRSRVSSVDLSVTHSLVRTREENVSIGMKLDANNPSTDILSTVLYRDRIRALRINASYDTVDRWQGIDLTTLTLSKGLDMFGARRTGAPDLSRLQGRSDFTKVEWS